MAIRNNKTLRNSFYGMSFGLDTGSMFCLELSLRKHWRIILGRRVNDRYSVCRFMGQVLEGQRKQNTDRN